MNTGGDLIKHQSWKELLWDEKQPCEIVLFKSNSIKVINLKGKLWLGAWLLWRIMLGNLLVLERCFLRFSTVKNHLKFLFFIAKFVNHKIYINYYFNRNSSKKNSMQIFLTIQKTSSLLNLRTSNKLPFHESLTSIFIPVHSSKWIIFHRKLIAVVYQNYLDLSSVQKTNSDLE